MSTLPPLKLTVPAAVSVELLSSVIVPLLKFSVEPAAALNAPWLSPPPAIAPPVQFSVPLTVTVPLPLRAPLERSRLETVAELSSVTVTASARIALSAGPGTWLGFQFAAVFQSPPAPLIQVISVARNEGVAAREMQSATG